MDKKQAADFVPLPQVASEIQKGRKCDAATARQVVKDAHQLGDLDLRLRRPDGSTDDQLDHNFWNALPWSDPDLVFQNGQVDAEMRRRPGSFRRVQPFERCRIVATRESLDLLLKPARRSPGAGRPDEHDWEEGELFFQQEFERRGNPLKKENQVKGWKSVSDAAKLVVEHLGNLSTDGQAPDFTTTLKKVSAWIKKLEAAQN